eukprot:419920_1
MVVKWQQMHYQLQIHNSLKKSLDDKMKQLTNICQKKIIGDINGYNPSKQSEISIKSHWGKYINYSKDKNVVKCGKKMHIFTSIPIKDDLFPTLVVLKSCNGNYLSLQDNG